MFQTDAVFLLPSILVRSCPVILGALYLLTSTGSVPDGHILVNCAGITRDNFMVKLDEAAWDSVVDINLKGSFLTTQAFARKVILHIYA